MIQEYIKALLFIFAAEFGDKTQLLAMAFATKYKTTKVLIGIFIGCLFNHGLAVLLGNYVSNIIPINTIQVIAGFSFVAFSLWTLKIDKEEENSKNKESFGPILTISIAFFIGELGDKTQLTAITLSATSEFPALILLGTVTGMVAVGGLGIFIGSKIGDKVPEIFIKFVSSAIFMFFGISKLLSSLPKKYLSPSFISLFIVTISIVVGIMIKAILNSKKAGHALPLKKQAKILYEYYNKINEHVNNLCLGESCCGSCQENNCIIGQTKELIKSLHNDSDNNIVNVDNINIFQNSINKSFDKNEIEESLGITIAFLENCSEKDNTTIKIKKIKENLELILNNKK